MPRALPFPGVRYAPTSLPDLAQVLCPAHHQVGELEAARLFLRHPANAVRLERGRDEERDHALFNRRVRAALTWDEWLAEGVLIRDALPSYYGYARQTPAGTLRGLVALYPLAAPVRLAAPPDPSRVQDRLEHLRAFPVQLHPALALVHDPDQLLGEFLLELMAEPPLHQGQDPVGASHQLYRAFSGPHGPRLDEVLATPPVLVDDSGTWQALSALHAEQVARGRPSHGWGMVMLVDGEDPALGLDPARLAQDPASALALSDLVPAGLVHLDLTGSLPTP